MTPTVLTVLTIFCIICAKCNERFENEIPVSEHEKLLKYAGDIETDFSNIITKEEKSLLEDDTAFYDERDVQQIVKPAKKVKKNFRNAINYQKSHDLISASGDLSSKFAQGLFGFEKMIIKRSAVSEPDFQNIESHEEHDVDDDESDTESSAPNGENSNVRYGRPVFAPPVTPGVNLSSKYHEALTDSSYTVKCVGNSSDVYWLDSRGRNISSIGIKVHAVHHRMQNMSELIFQHITDELKGSYRCVNSIGKMTSTSDFYLMVTSRSDVEPTVRLNVTEYRICLEENETLYVLCTGNSRNITWFKDREPVGSRYDRLYSQYHVHSEMHSYLNESLLIIDHAVLSSSGQYSCSVGRNGRNATASVVLTVRLPTVPTQTATWSTVPEPTATLSVFSETTIEMYEGQELHVPCYGNTQNIQWKTSSLTVIPHGGPGSSYDPYVRVTGNNQLSLYFGRIRQSHAGYYTCSVERGSATANVGFSLRVLDFPKLEFSPPKDVVTVETKGKYSVKCEHRRISNAHWIGPDGLPVKDSSGNLRVEQTFFGMKLVFEKASRKHTGVYNCSGHMEHTPVYKLFHFTVHKKEILPEPIFESIETSVIIGKVGATLNVTCSGEASPIVWKIAPQGFIIPYDTASHSSRIRATDVAPLNDDEFFSTLIIERLELNDANTYTCEVTDGQQKKSRSLTVRVIEPVHFESNLPSHYEVNETSDIVLQCGARGYPLPTVEWFLEVTEPTVHMKPVRGSEYIVTDDTIIVKQARYNHTGVYKCRATQVEGTSGYRSMYLRVRHKPIFLTGPNITIYTYFNNTMNLTCDEVSYPKSDYTWHKDGMRIAYRKPINTLTVTFNNDESFGDYVCEAANELGYGLRTITVKEMEKPDVPSVKVTKAEGTNIWLSITSKGEHIHSYKVQYKTPYYETFNEQIIPKDNSTSEYELSNLITVSLYTIRAASINLAGESEFSQNVTAKTTNSAFNINSSIFISFLSFSVSFYCLYM